MEKKIIKRIVLKPIKAIRQSANNPYMRGLVTKRDLTTREACHIYREIYLFNLDHSLDDFESKEERDYFYKDITRTMNDYITVLEYENTEFSDIPPTTIGSICFVHELQHALRICGIDKNIEI